MAPAEQLKSEFGSTTYAQFAALHLAALAVNEGKLPDAEAQLRWVLGKADKGSDIAQVAQLRLARVLAASGATDQALAILAEAEPGAYGASYAAAKGDILLAAGRNDEARDAYSLAVASAAGGGARVESDRLATEVAESHASTSTYPRYDRKSSAGYCGCSIGHQMTPSTPRRNRTMRQISRHLTHTHHGARPGRL